MLLPILLSDSFAKYEGVEDDDALFLSLKQAPLSEVLSFFAVACEDETWSLSHKEFFQKMLQFITTLFLEDKLTLHSLKGIISALQTHFSALNSIIPKNLTLRVQEGSVSLNSFLAATLSPVLLFEMKEVCGEEGSGTIVLTEDITFLQLLEMVHTIETSDTSTLYKLTPDQLWELMRSAFRLKHQTLEKGVAKTLKRYLDGLNVISYLKRSCTEGFQVMAEICFDVIDHLGWDFEVRTKNFPFLTVRFRSFSDNALKFYEEFKGQIEGLGVINDLSEEVLFRDLVKGCSRLTFLSVEQTFNICPYFAEFPRNLKELDLSMCPWLGDKEIKTIFSQFPLLTRCLLTSNSQIGASGFRALSDLKELKSLDISRSPQVRDEELRLIIKAAPHLEEFSLDGCPGITSNGFYELARGYWGLIELNVARTEITSPCLIELAEHNPFIQNLVLDRAQALTFKGIDETLRSLSFLKKVSLQGCHVSKEQVDALRTTFPKVSIS